MKTYRPSLACKNGTLEPVMVLDRGADWVRREDAEVLREQVTEMLAQRNEWRALVRSKQRS